MDRHGRRAAGPAGRLLLGLGGLLAALLLGLAGVLAFAAKVARRVVTPPTVREEELRILGTGDGTVTLSRAKVTRTRGRYSLWFADSAGHAKIGRIVREDEHGVTREVIAVDFGELAAPSTARINGWYFLHPRELGLECEEVLVPTEYGPAPAWHLPPSTPSTRWAILLHGRAVQRAETLRAVPVFHEAGYHCLVISYRNDGEAPDSPDGLYALGDTEWRDADAAMAFAQGRGATEFVLNGWSMGGATVLQASLRSPRAGLIRGLVLDSPVIDWIGVLEHQAGSQGVPPLFRWLAMALLRTRWGRILLRQRHPIDLDRLNLVKHADLLRVPVLLLHSDGDDYVPSKASRRLAAARPDLVRFERFTRAGHTRLWNYDPERWPGAIKTWLADLARSETTASRGIPRRLPRGS